MPYIIYCIGIPGLPRPGFIDGEPGERNLTIYPRNAVSFQTKGECQRVIEECAIRWRCFESRFTILTLD